MSDVSTKKVLHDTYFTKKQMEWLESMFPENTTPNQTDNAVREQVGARRVLSMVRQRVQSVGG